MNIYNKKDIDVKVDATEVFNGALLFLTHFRRSHGYFNQQQNSNDDNRKKKKKPTH